MEKTENFSVRVPAGIADRVDSVAASMDRSRNWLINQAIDQFLDVYEWQAARIRERLSLAENGGSFRTGEDVDDIVESFKR